MSKCEGADGCVMAEQGRLALKRIGPEATMIAEGYIRKKSTVAFLSGDMTRVASVRSYLEAFGVPILGVAMCNAEHGDPVRVKLR